MPADVPMKTTIVRSDKANEQRSIDLIRWLLQKRAQILARQANGEAA